MVIIDSSVWIDAFKKIDNPYTRLFECLCETRQAALIDLILYEVLSGVKPEARYDKVKENMLSFPVILSDGIKTVLNATENSLKLQKNGCQIATIDCLISTICLDNDLYLLTKDKDFIMCEEHIGLKLLSVH